MGKKKERKKKGKHTQGTRDDDAGRSTTDTADRGTTRRCCGRTREWKCVTRVVCFSPRESFYFYFIFL